MRIKELIEINEQTKKSKVHIREKIIGHKFSFKKDKNGSIHFYGKKQKKKIALIDRLLSDLYENPISKILKNINGIRTNLIYHTYFNDNKIILIGITDSDMYIDDIEVLRTMSKIIGIDYQDVLYDGYLSDDDFRKLTDNDFSFLDVNHTHFGGLILSFENGEIYKVKNKSIEINIQKHDTAIFELAVKEILEFLHNKMALNKIRFHDSKNREIRFIDLVLKLFIQFISVSSIEVQWPRFLEHAGSINRKYITDFSVIKFIEGNKNNEYLLRIFLLVVMGRIKEKGMISADDANESELIFIFLKDYINSRGVIDFTMLKKINRNNV